MLLQMTIYLSAYYVILNINNHEVDLEWHRKKATQTLVVQQYCQGPPPMLKFIFQVKMSNLISLIWHRKKIMVHVGCRSTAVTGLVV